jgi:hypothetical protein
MSITTPLPTPPSTLRPSTLNADTDAFLAALPVFQTELNNFASNVAQFGRNRLINADFRINQRGYVSAATLAAGVYGHDRWKAGSGGGDYSFTQLKSDTAITIASGKTLMQVVEDVNVEGGGYCLSWTGTAQGRIAISGGSTSGAYAVSPIYVAAATAGQTITVEFNTGTLGKVQLEPATAAVATPFERINYGASLLQCQRYYYSLTSLGNSAAMMTAVVYATGNQPSANFPLPVKMRATPTVAFVGTMGIGIGGVGVGTATININRSSPALCALMIDITISGSPGQVGFFYDIGAVVSVTFSAEL